jgi:hypothetical protein
VVSAISLKLNDVSWMGDVFEWPTGEKKASAGLYAAVLFQKVQDNLCLHGYDLAASLPLTPAV